MLDAPAETPPNHPISVSDSEQVTPRDPPTHTSPSQLHRKRPLSSPQSPTPKRPRTQTIQSPSHLDQPSSPIPNQTPPPAFNSHSQTQSPTPQLPPVKSADVPSPSAPRRTSGTPTKNTNAHADPKHQDSDEDDAPLNLAQISSYEYEQVAKLNPIQLRRYEQYRRSDLKNAKVRRLILAISPTSKPNDPYIIAVKGLAKLFVGDIVETALHAKKTLGDKGALQPKHIREAYRRLRREGAVPFTTQSDTNLR